MSTNETSGDISTGLSNLENRLKLKIALRTLNQKLDVMHQLN